MKKRILSILAFLVLIPTMVFATKVAITWEWMIDDPQVTGFRYQLDDENSEKWVVVDGETTMAVFQNLEGSQEYSLYLQQTFDGVNWSDSAVSVAYPLFDAEEAPAEEAPAEEIAVVEEAPVEEVVAEEAPAEEVVVEEAPVEEVVAEEAPAEEIVVEEAPAEVVVEEAPVEEVAVVEEAPVEEMEEALVVDNSRYFTSIAINGGGSYDLKAVSGYKELQPVLGLTFGFNNIKTFNEKVGLGLDLDVNAIGYIPTGVGYFDEIKSLFQDNTEFSLQILLVPEIEFDFGKVGMDLGLLGGLTLVNVNTVGEANITPSSSQFDYGVFTYGAKVGLNYEVAKFFTLSLDATATKINDLSITDFDYSIDGTLSFVFTF